MLKLTATVFAATLAFTGVSHAGSVYSFDVNRQGHKMIDQDGNRVAAGINDRAGRIKNVSGSYDTDAQTFSYSTEIGKNRGSSFDGFWLVINGGGGTPGALGQIGKIGILYFDAHAKDITVYQYTRRGTRSYQDGELIASTRVDDSFVQSLDVTNNGNSQTASFTLDIDGFNTALGGDWMGLVFGKQVGIWMSVFDHGKVRYGQDGSIHNWRFCQRGWFDASTIDTVETETVPTPSAAMAGIAGLGLLASRRKKRAA